MRTALLALALSCTLAARAAGQDAAAAAAAPATQRARTVRTAPADLLTDLRDDGSLVAGLDDPSAEVRWVAARGLARLAEAEQIPALAARVARESDEDILAELVFALGQRGHFDAAAAAPPLVALLGHERPAIRAAAVAALARLASDQDTARIIELLASDPDPEVRGAAALALFRLDGRRYDHARTAAPDVLDVRDALLGRIAVSDPDSGVRWRATYALAGIKGRPDLARVQPKTVSNAKEPLSRLLALRGLRALEGDGLVDPAPLHVEQWLRDPDEGVQIEAARALSLSGSPDALADTLRGAASALVRYSAALSLRERLARPDIDDATRAQWCEALQPAAMKDASPMVRREVAALIVALAPPDHALFDLYLLVGSDDRRDRERAAKELAAREPPLVAPGLLERLLHDEPAVAAEALAAPAPPDVRKARLVEALAATDAALVATAAEQAMKPAASAPADAKPAPPTDPALVAALKAAHERAVGPEMKEARAMLRKALGLPPDTEPPKAPAAGGNLLERSIAEHRAALADPSPRVHLITSKGVVVLELDRVNAPRHVASFLELAAAGFYDGLDFHRVVPNFVVQGLDPRGDGYGTGGRRLPDEFSPRHYEAGALGMPNAGEPHTGGCQIFITHVPTPHLDGNYTIFGKVIEGMDVVQKLEIGDTVSNVLEKEYIDTLIKYGDAGQPH
jgi:cyclophilin family peptidyl-prolyl cis-trans isomerase